MIRRLIILLLIVSCVFGDTIRYSDNDMITIENDIKYLGVEDGYIYYSKKKILGKQKIIKIKCEEVFEILFTNINMKDQKIDCSINTYGITGCFDKNACNHNPNAVEDNGSCEYPKQNFDCRGNCLAVDCVGVCGGDNTSCADCAGVPNGLNIEDECGVCGGDNTSCADCAGVPNGLNIEDCAGVCGGSSQVDECGVCGGSGILEGECDCYGEKENIYGNCGSDSFDNKKLFLLIEGNYGIVRDVNSNFNQVYGNSNNISGVGFGIGWKNTYIIAQYKLYEAKGKSLVSGIDLEGIANWKEEFIILALRNYKDPFFTELGYVLNSVEEVISTNQPIYTDLNSNYSTNGNEGISIVFGVNIPIDGLILSADVNYIYVLSKTEDESNNNITNVGGLMFNVGLGIKL